MLLVDGSQGGFEAGFGEGGGGGQTREHAQLARSLGVEHAIVVVRKTPTRAACVQHVCRGCRNTRGAGCSVSVGLFIMFMYLHITTSLDTCFNVWHVHISTCVCFHVCICLQINNNTLHRP